MANEGRPTFFVDHNLGNRVVADALRSLGYDVLTHTDLFENNTPDVEWLPEVGQRRLILLTKDTSITRNPLELRALLESSIVGFFFEDGRQHCTGPQIASAYSKCAEQMVELWKRHKPPLLGTVNSKGQLRQYKNYDDIVQSYQHNKSEREYHAQKRQEASDRLPGI